MENFQVQQHPATIETFVETEATQLPRIILHLLWDVSNSAKICRIDKAFQPTDATLSPDHSTFELF